jgi:hypothetical protein
MADDNALLDVGRELTAAELVPKTVVILGRADRAVMVTTWVQSVGVDFVAFYHGAVHTTFIARRLPDDTLTDDSGARILVFEYLGVV